MSRRMRLFLLAWIVVIAPAAGYIGATLITNNNPSTPTLHPPLRTTAQLQTALNKYINSRPIGESLPESKIISFKRFNDGWYVVTVAQQSGSVTIKQKALIGDFYSSDSKLRIVVPPNGSLPDGDISNSMGVPYAAITELYK